MKVAYVNQRTAGEVRFIKDKSDSGNWAFNDTGHQQREIIPSYKFDPKKLKALAQTLRSTSMAMGHALSAYNHFTRIKSSGVSPDGMLGGKGYILKVKDMRSMYMNAVEALSSLSDTLYDEVHADHWSGATTTEVEQLIDDAEAIRQDPEGYAEAEEQEMNEDGVAKKVATSYLRMARQVNVYDDSGSIHWTGTMKDLIRTRKSASEIRRLTRLREGQVLEIDL